MLECVILLLFLLLFSVLISVCFYNIFGTIINPVLYYWMTIPFSFIGVVINDFNIGDYSVSINYLLSVSSFVLSFLLLNLIFKSDSNSNFINPEISFNGYNNIRSVYFFISVFVSFFIVLLGAPILSSNVDYERVQIMVEHPFLIRIIWFVLPMFYLSILHIRINKIKVKYAETQDYIFFTLLLIPYFLIGNKGQVLSLVIMLVVFFSINNKANDFFNRKILIGFGVLSLFYFFSIHSTSSENDFIYLMNKIFIRLTVVDGISDVFHDYVPNNGYMYGDSFLFEINGVLSKFGLTDPSLTQTTGGYIARYVSGYDSDYKFEFVFPFFVQAYLNFGIIGNVILSSVLGSTLFIITNKIKKTSSIFFVYKFLIVIMIFSIFSSGKLGSFLVTSFLTYTIVIAFLYIISKYRFKI